MNKKNVLATYLLTVIGQPKMIGRRNLALEEIESIIEAMCDAGKAVQGFDIRCKKLKKGIRLP